MLNKISWFTLILSLTSVALAQEGVQSKPATLRVEAASSQATQTCQVTYSSGNDRNTLTQFCVTVNGNIPQFSLRNTQLFPPAGNAADLEGYGFCDFTAFKRYYDYAAYDNGSWNPSTLTQTIVNVPATASATGSAKITMKLKNLSSVSRVASLLRYAGEDVGGVNNI